MPSLTVAEEQARVERVSGRKSWVSGIDSGAGILACRWSLDIFGGAEPAVTEGPARVLSEPSVVADGFFLRSTEPIRYRGRF
jgi:hypothetical protein